MLVFWNIIVELHLPVLQHGSVKEILKGWLGTDSKFTNKLCWLTVNYKDPRWGTCTIDIYINW
jgi:hypothetical protein